MKVLTAGLLVLAVLSGCTYPPDHKKAAQLAINNWLSPDNVGRSAFSGATPSFQKEVREKFSPCFRIFPAAFQRSSRPAVGGGDTVVFATADCGGTTVGVEYPGNGTIYNVTLIGFIGPMGTSIAKFRVDLSNSAVGPGL